MTCKRSTTDPLLPLSGFENKVPKRLKVFFLAICMHKYCRCDGTAFRRTMNHYSPIKRPGRVAIRPRQGVAIKPRQGVTITPCTQNWSGNGFYNTNHSEIGAEMNFLTPNTSKSTWCYYHPLLYLLF